MAKTFNIDGYRVYCTPSFTTGPKGKEAGLVTLVSNDIASSIIIKHDINNKVDTIPTLWIQLKYQNRKLDMIIGGICRRSKPSTDAMLSELEQLHQQILLAAQSGKNVVLMGDLNLDHNNSEHNLTKEANDLLGVVEAANMRHVPNKIPTWRSYGF